MRHSAVRSVLRRKMVLIASAASSAIGNASQTSSSRPVRASSHATGSSTTSCRVTALSSE